MMMQAPNQSNPANLLCYHISLLNLSNTDWVTPHFRDFPRYCSYTDMEQYTVVMPEEVTSETLARHMVWIVQNLNGRWSFTTNGFVFEDELEATLFSLQQ